MENVNEITLQVTPKTMARLQENPDLMQELYSQINNDQILEGIIECENEDPIAPEIQAGGSQGEDESRTFWVDAAVKLLLSTVEELSPHVGKSLKLKTKKRMWERAKEVLNSAGYSFSITQIENKYKGLERNFKNAKNHNNKTGRDRRSCPYEKELGGILEKKSSVYPSCLLGAQSSQEMCREEIIAATAPENSHIIQNTFVEDTSSHSLELNTDSTDTPTSAKKASKQDEILQELRKMQEETKEFRANLLQSVVNNEKLMEEKNKLAKERNDIMRERNEILKMLASRNSL